MSEYDDAKAWRERHGLTQAKLAELTGYSREAVCWAESGRCPPGRRQKEKAKIQEWVWQRYKNCCAAVDNQLKTGKKFHWR